MNYRSIANLNEAIVRAMPRVPRDVDLIVGVPRSGLLAANMLSLHLNMPLTDLRGLIEKRLLQGGKRMSVGSEFFDRVKKVLVLDDSINSGSAIERAREQLAAGGVDYELVFAAVYVTEENKHLADIGFEVLQTPRMFEWNVMHQALLSDCCVDIDGVLCRDPSPEENDDGPIYEKFLLETQPLFIPTVEIGTLVTCRLTKYRALTEQWLANHGVRYRELLMLDLPNKEARIAAGIHGKFKAEAYTRQKAALFIESDPFQAAEIADLTGKPVLCVSTRRMVYPGSLLANATELARRKTSSLMRRARRFLSRRINAMLGHKPVEEVAPSCDPESVHQEPTAEPQVETVEPAKAEVTAGRD